MRLFLSLILFAACGFGQSWTSFNNGTDQHNIGWQKPMYDPVSGRVAVWYQDWSVSSTIYSSSMFSFRSSDGTFIKVGSSGSGAGAVTVSGLNVTRTSGMPFNTNGSWIGGSQPPTLGINGAGGFTVASMSDSSHLVLNSGSPTSGAYSMNCPNSSSTWYGDRHVTAQVAVDTTRNRLYQYGGLCTGENGGSHDSRETWYLTLNAAPASATFTNLGVTAHDPNAKQQAAMVYSSANDVIFWWGYDNGAGTNINWLFCPTTSGTLSAKQVALGLCSPSGTPRPDDWIALTGATGPGGLCSGAISNCPPGQKDPGLVYDVLADKVIMFGGVTTDPLIDPAILETQTWAFDIPTQTWTQRNPATHPPAQTSTLSKYPCMAYDTRTHVTYVQDPVTQHTWSYAYAADAWTDHGVTGGPTVAETLAYDATQHALVMVDGNDQNKIWVGQLTAAPVVTTTSPLTACTHGSSCSRQLDADGIPASYTWTKSAGALPTGLTLNSAGLLSGTPTLAGTYTFTASVSNGISPDGTKQFQITINPLCEITSVPFPGGVLSTPYSQPVTTTECASPSFAVTAGAMPTGLSLNSGTGIISGTPSVIGLSNFTVTVTDANGNPVQPFTMLIVSGPGQFSVPVCSGCILR